MKTVFVFMLICAFSISSAQEFSNNVETDKYFISTSVRSNITGASNIGMGLTLSLGYNINQNFSFMVTSGYMTSYTNPYNSIHYRMWDSNANDYILSTYSYGRQDHKFIPVDLSFRYNFTVSGFQPYVSVMAGWSILLNEGNYSVSNVTKYESSNQLIESTSGMASDQNAFSKTVSTFGMGLGFGALIPVSSSLKLDVSYLYFSNPGIHSIGLGLNFGIK